MRTNVIKLLSGPDLKFRKLKLPRIIIVGIASVILLYVSTAGLVSVTNPWWSRGDTKQHVDYIWRISHGEIPRWHDGVRYPPFLKLPGYFNNQSASANPPLFYLLEAPIVAPILNSGHWQAAIGVGRAVNIFIGVLCIFALAWAGWLFGGRKRALMAIAVPALSVLMYRFTRLNVDYAIDALLVLFSTLSLILNYKLLQYGLKRKYLIALLVLSILGMSTKAPYIVLLAVNLLAVLIAAVIHSRAEIKKRILKGALISTAVLIIVTLAIGWFYYFYNYKSSGKLFSSSPSGYTGGRPYKSLQTVLTTKPFWATFYANFAKIEQISVAISSIALAGLLITNKGLLARITKDRAKFLSLLLMILAFFGIVLTQLNLAVGHGSVNQRYLLPAVLPIALVLAYGLGQFKRVEGQLISLAAIAMAGATIYEIGGVHLSPIRAAAAANGLPVVIPVLLLLFFVIGSLLLSVSLFAASKKQS